MKKPIIGPQEATRALKLNKPIDQILFMQVQTQGYFMPLQLKVEMDLKVDKRYGGLYLRLLLENFRK